MLSKLLHFKKFHAIMEVQIIKKARKLEMKTYYYAVGTYEKGEELKRMIVEFCHDGTGLTYYIYYKDKDVLDEAVTILESRNYINIGYDFNSLFKAKCEEENDPDYYNEFVTRLMTIRGNK